MNHFNCPFCDDNISNCGYGQRGYEDASGVYDLYSCRRCQVHLTTYSPTGRIEQVQFVEKDIQCILDIDSNWFKLVNAHGPIKLFCQGSYPSDLTLPQLRQKFLDKINLYVLFS